MAKVVMPLGSAEASGLFGPRMVFSKRKSGQQVRFQKAQVSIVPSDTQADVHVLYRLAFCRWNNMTANEKLVYENFVSQNQLNMTGYNYFLGLCLDDPYTYLSLALYFSFNKNEDGSFSDLSKSGITCALKPNYPSSCPSRISSKNKKLLNAYSLNGVSDYMQIDMKNAPSFFSVSTKESSPRGIFFSPDGTKMYIVGNVSDSVHEYNLNIAWDVESAEFVQSFSVSTKDPTPSGVSFSPDGTKMYIVGTFGNQVLYYDLGTAWNISTAVFTGTFSVSDTAPSPIGIYIKSDGSGFFLVSFSNGSVYRFTFGTPFDMSTASYASDFFSVSSQAANPTGIFFSPDGAKMYIAAPTNDGIHSYTLSTPWVLSTVSFDSKTLFIYDYETTILSLFFSPDGTKMYIIGTASQKVFVFNLLVAWNLLLYNRLGTNAITCGFWYKTDELFQSDDAIMFQNSGFLLFRQAGNDVQLYAFLLATGSGFSSPHRYAFRGLAQLNNDNQWHYRVYCVYVDETEQKARMVSYEDGVICDSDRTQSFSGNNGSPVSDLFIGSRGIGVFKKIDIDEISFYNRKLSLGEIKSIYNSFK